METVGFDLLEGAYPERPDEFTFELRGIKCRAKAVNDASEKLRIIKKMREGVETIQKMPSPEWKPFLPAEPLVLQGVMLVNILMIEPPVSVPKALEWACKRSDLFEEICDNLNKQLARVSQMEAEEVENEKND